MATYTDNYNLKKPDGTDPADIGDLNDNMDALDAALKPSIVDSLPPQDSGLINQSLSYLAWMIKAITGKNSWKTAPAKTLEQLDDHIGAGGAAHTEATASRAGFLSAADKTLIAGATSAATGGTLVKRTSSGQATFADPTAAGHAVTKRYLDGKLPKIATGTYRGSYAAEGDPETKTITLDFEPIAVFVQPRWGQSLPVKPDTPSLTYGGLAMPGHNVITETAPSRYESEYDAQYCAVSVQGADLIVSSKGNCKANNGIIYYYIAIG